MNDTIVIYHKGCADGFGAAWAVYRAIGMDAVEYYPGIYNDDPPDVTEKKVIMVDFSYKYDVLLEMAEKATQLTIIDHHESAKRELEKFESRHVSGIHCPYHIKFDNDKSGALLAWEYFHSKKPPHLIYLIQDRDLWRFEYSNTRPVMMAVYIYPFEFDVWDNLMQIDYMKTLEHDGAVLQKKYDTDLERVLAQTTRTIELRGYKIPLANVPPMFTSDAGNKLAVGNPFAALYYDTADWRIFGLRSDRNSPNSIDVSVIAVELGGGGHKHASGFRVPRSHFLAQC